MSLMLLLMSLLTKAEKKVNISLLRLSSSSFVLNIVTSRLFKTSGESIFDIR